MSLMILSIIKHIKYDYFFIILYYLIILVYLKLFNNKELSLKFIYFLFFYIKILKKNNFTIYFNKMVFIIVIKI